MIWKILIASSLVLLKTQVDAAGSWNYNNFSAWGNVNAVCNNGQRQSPINIVKLNVIEDPEMHHIQAVNYNANRTGTYLIKNTGYGIKVTPEITNAGADDHPYTVHGHSAYILDSFHFHWGRNDSEGSEHTVDGKKYPAEVHFVHFNRKYPNISVAIDKTDGLLVRGVLYMIDSQNNTELMPIIDALSSVKYPDNKTTINYIPPQNFFPKNWGPYFNYLGSLTTPGCFETVNWFVHQEVAKISSYQLEKLRWLYSDKTGSTMVTHNYRPTQNLFTRKVKARKVDKSFITLTPPKWDNTSPVYGWKQWPTLFPICRDSLSTSRQSPINIDSTKTKYNQALKPLETPGWKSTSNTNMLISNNGHTITVGMQSGLFPSTIKHKGQTYQTHHFHFHWANTTSTGGSEHTYDNKQFFAEVHFVHYNTKYANIGEAMVQSDGLLVWGHFIQAKNGSSDHAAYKKITDEFSKVMYKGKSTPIAYIPLYDLVPPNSNHYYTYPGSLTTPHCFESVTWIVNRDIIDISPAQAAKFLSVYETEQGKTPKAMLDNWRGVQNINGRTVEVNFGGESSSATGIHASIVMLVAVCLFYLAL